MTRIQRRRFARLRHNVRAAMLRAYFVHRKIVKVCDLHDEPRVAQ